MSETKTAEQRIAEIEQRRTARRDKAGEARAEQYARDLEAIDAIEVEKDEELSVLHVAGYRAGLPVVVGVRAPSQQYYKRFASQIRRAKDNLEERAKAQDMLADVCWAYPADEPTRKAMLEAFPGTLVSVAVEAAKLAELRSAEEGKG